MSDHRVILGDCVSVMREMADASVDAVVTDPPYGLEFMGKDWDAPWQASSKSALFGDRATAMPGWSVTRNPTCRTCGGRLRGAKRCECAAPAWDEAPRATFLRQMQGFGDWCATWAEECLRVLKPGGHLLAFGGTRTYHRMACAIEDAGFEIRDSLHWMYGSGFPKSLDVSKAIDAAAGAERTPTGETRTRHGGGAHSANIAQLNPDAKVTPLTAPATPEAAAWSGWGTALKPAHEPIVLARKPLIGTVAANILAHGTGALNIDASRVAYQGAADQTSAIPQGKATAKVGALAGGTQNDAARTEFKPDNTKGRWPPNVLLSDEAAAELDRQSGDLQSGQLLTHHRRSGTPQIGTFEIRDRTGEPCNFGGDSGGASRFFPVFRYVAKPARGERDAGLHDDEPVSGGKATGRKDGSDGLKSPRAGAGRNGGARNFHPTVKPVALMEWLVQLVTPPGGTVLDPFLGSGTTGCAAVRLGFNFIGVEREAEYVALAERRIRLAANAPRSKGLGDLERVETPANQIALFGVAP